MAKEMETPKDEGLQGNETIEEAILGLQKEPTPELLAHVLTVIRRRMKEGGQAILSVEPPSGDDQIRIGTVKSADGKVWWAAFTSFDEELKGSSSVKSTFLVSLEQLIHMASETKEISGRNKGDQRCDFQSVEPHDHAGSYAAFDYHRGRERRTLISYFTWPDYDAAHNQLRLRIAWVMMLREKKKIA